MTENEWAQQGPTNEWAQQGPTNEWAQGPGPTGPNEPLSPINIYIYIYIQVLDFGGGLKKFFGLKNDIF